MTIVITLGGERMRFVVGFLTAGALLSGATTAAAATSYTTGSGCVEHQAFVEGDEVAVASRLPDGYEPIRTAAGAPLVFARAIRCDEVAAGGEGYPAVQANYGVVVESPDGLGCLSAAPLAGPLKGDALPICNWYTLAWLADDHRAVDWLRSGTSGFPAHHAPDMSFDLADDGAFHFEAQGARPFAIDAVLGGESPGEKAVRGGYWAETAAGTVKLVASSNELTSGGAEGTVAAPPGSELAALMGAGQREYAAGYSDFAAIGIRRGSYRKQQLAPAPHTRSFEGSCAVEGDVEFSPRLTNAVAQATYDYTATGTCSGALAGRELSDEPVQLHQTGPVEAACQEAHTTFPGHGEITFGSRWTVEYTLDFTATLTEVDFMVYGTRSGFARGQGSFLTDRTPADIPQQCSGEGLGSAPLDMTLSTERPLVSNDGGRLSASVTPRAVTVGRRRAFRFRVLTPAGEPARGAVVRFAGRSATVRRSGRAKIVARLKRAGRHRARVAKHGFGPVRLSVRARPA
jgi:hypothetical protein